MVVVGGVCVCVCGGGGGILFHRGNDMPKGQFFDGMVDLYRECDLGEERISYLYRMPLPFVDVLNVRPKQSLFAVFGNQFSARGQNSHIRIIS